MYINVVIITITDAQIWALVHDGYSSTQFMVQDSVPIMNQELAYDSILAHYSILAPYSNTFKFGIYLQALIVVHCISVW